MYLSRGEAVLLFPVNVPLGASQMLTIGDQVMSPFSRMQVRASGKITNSSILHISFFIILQSDGDDILL